MYHCHAFVQAIAVLLEEKTKKEGKEIYLIEFEEESLAAERIHGEGIVLDKTLAKYFTATDTFTLATSNAFESAKRAVKYISDDAQLLYFGKATAYKDAGIFNTKLPIKEPRKGVGLEVIDLPSLQDRATRFLAINAILAERWKVARNSWSNALLKPPKEDTRAPTFIVVDEAHNWIPADPDTRTAKKLREQFRTIVSEGRKYGLFLVVVSQRPDKLDYQVLSECENKAIMKLSSRSVLDLTTRALGLEDLGSNVLNKCLEFAMGRVLLVGNWAPEGPRLCYAAARRTVEGGRNLRKEYWAQPIDRKLPKPGAAIAQATVPETEDGKSGPKSQKKSDRAQPEGAIQA
jgi:hypothetical protein